MVTGPHAACSRKILCHGPDPSGHSKRKFDRKEGYEDARSRGSDILSVRQARALGPQGVIDRIPKVRVSISPSTLMHSAHPLRPAQERQPRWVSLL